MLYKGSTSLVCTAFEQIVGQTFVDPVDSLTLAFGLRFTFKIFDKLYYLDLEPFAATWWLAVVFDLALTWVFLTDVLEQVRLKLLRMCRQRCGERTPLTLTVTLTLNLNLIPLHLGERLAEDPCCTKLVTDLSTNVQLQGTRLYRRQHVRDWTPSDQRKLKAKTLNPNLTPPPVAVGLVLCASVWSIG